MMSELSEEKPVNKICVYGDQGTGKTVHAMKMAQHFTPQDKWILYVDTKENWSSLLNHPELKKRVKKLPYKNWEQLYALAQAINAQQPPFDMFGAVVIDEFNSAIANDLNWIVAARAKQADEDNTGFKDPFQPTQPDYLASQIRAAKVTDLFVMTPSVHIFYTSHEKVDELNVTRPDMKPGAANDMQRALHGVYRATLQLVGDKGNQKLVRMLQLQPVKKISAKNRIGGLGVYATVEQVIAAYEGWGQSKDKTEETPKVEATVTEEPVQPDSDINSLLD